MAFASTFARFLHQHQDNNNRDIVKLSLYARHRCKRMKAKLPETDSKTCCSKCGNMRLFKHVIRRPYVKKRRRVKKNHAPELVKICQFCNTPQPDIHLKQWKAKIASAEKNIRPGILSGNIEANIDTKNEGKTSHKKTVAKEKDAAPFSQSILNLQKLMMAKKKIKGMKETASLLKFLVRSNK